MDKSAPRSAGPQEEGGGDEGLGAHRGRSRLPNTLLERFQGLLERCTAFVFRHRYKHAILSYADRGVYRIL